MKFGRTLFAGLFAAALALPVFANQTQTAPSTQPSAQNTTPSNMETVQNANQNSTSSKNTMTEDKTDAKQKHSNNTHKSQQQAKWDNDAAQPVNINTASVDDLKNLKGIGQKRAEAIVKYRDSNGNFASVDDLMKVKGISKSFLEQNRDHLTIG